MTNNLAAAVELKALIDFKNRLSGTISPGGYINLGNDLHAWFFKHGETILAELGRGADRKLEQCPDGCYRPKATSADDCAAGCCSKWYAVRDKAASDECEKLAAFWKRPPVAGLAELTDGQWVKLFIKMDEAFTGVDDEHCVPLIATAAREFLGKVE